MMKRLTNLAIVGLCFLFFPIRGDAKKNNGKPRTFAIINSTRNIGDVICTTPLMRAIKVANPDARVLFIGSPKNQLTLEGNTDVDRYIVYDQPLRKLIRELRQEKIDAAVAINFSVIEIGLFFLSGVKGIACFTFGADHYATASKPYRLLSLLMHRIVYTPGVYVPGQYLKLLAPFGIDSSDVRKHLAYSKKAKTTVEEALRQRGIGSDMRLVAISPGAGTKIKQWPAKRFAAVGNHIAMNQKAAILIIGGPGDKTETDAMEQALDGGVKYCNFSAQSLDELKATLSMVDLIIGNDSGPIYVAESFGAATLVLVGPTDETEHPLQDDRHKVVVAKRSGPLMQSYVNDEDAINLEEARSQMESITVEEVCRETDSLLASL